jgi:hypothetical protein
MLTDRMLPQHSRAQAIQPSSVQHCAMCVHSRKSGYGSCGPSGRLKGARVIVFSERQAAAVSQTYLRLEDGTALTQQPAFRPPWRRAQWACEAGVSQLTELQCLLAWQLLASSSQCCAACVILQPARSLLSLTGKLICLGTQRQSVSLLLAGIAVKRLMFGEGIIKHQLNVTVHNAFLLGAVCTLRRVTACEPYMHRCFKLRTEAHAQDPKQECTRRCHTRDLAC